MDVRTIINAEKYLREKGFEEFRLTIPEVSFKDNKRFIRFIINFASQYGFNSSSNNDLVMIGEALVFLMSKIELHSLSNPFIKNLKNMQVKDYNNYVDVVDVDAKRCLFQIERTKGMIKIHPITKLQLKEQEVEFALRCIIFLYKEFTKSRKKKK
jgi:hypothetical protein